MSFYPPLTAKAAHSRTPAAGAASSSPGSLQRSRSDVDVNAAATATARTRMPAVPTAAVAAASPFSSASALPPGSYASLGEEKIPPTAFLCKP